MFRRPMPQFGRNKKERVLNGNVLHPLLQVRNNGLLADDTPAGLVGTLIYNGRTLIEAYQSAYLCVSFNTPVGCSYRLLLPPTMTLSDVSKWHDPGSSVVAGIRLPKPHVLVVTGNK